MYDYNKSNSLFNNYSYVSTIFWAQNQVSVFDSIIPSLPWGVVSLVDLYAGFILVGIWIFYKEKTVSALVWIFLNDFRQSDYSNM